MSGLPERPSLADSLRRERRARRLSLRDLAAEIDVSFNTLSRVERGYLPDLKNYDKIVRWLGLPASTFLDSDSEPTPEVISRHLFADPRLTEDGAISIAKLVEDLYAKLASPTVSYAVHMRSAKTFLPEAGNALADIIEEMHTALAREHR